MSAWSPERRARQAALMRALNADRHFVEACAAGRATAAARVRRADALRGFHVPPEQVPFYRKVRLQVGAAEARRIIEAEMARVNA